LINESGDIVADFDSDLAVSNEGLWGSGINRQRRRFVREEVGDSSDSKRMLD
jgi:hypothetical protein